MTKFIFIVITAICCSFTAGYFVSSYQHNKQTAAKKVTGIGGIFFKSKAPKELKAWYQQHLGLISGQYGAHFEWRYTDNTQHKGFLLWAPFNEKTSYFKPSEKEFMINYRVEDLTGLLKSLKEEGVTIVDTMETAPYGKFVHILDLEGNKLELWEPNDTEYEKMGKGEKTNH
jgi:predicted enzyme related to lactoylglutathione lyase